MNGRSFETDIAQFETGASASGARREGRQATRYHVHGIHEYKGKFNPQVVRAFANLLEFRAGRVLLDPFCGSGTALSKGSRLAATPFGIDRSPVAVLISRAKTETWQSANPRRIALALTHWLEGSEAQIERAQQSERRDPNGLSHLDATSIRYLEGWFSPGALAALSVARSSLRKVRLRPARLLGQVAISSIVRKVSMQLPEDLRVRRRPEGSEPEMIVPTLRASLTNIVLGLEELAEFPARARGNAVVVEGCSVGRRGIFARPSVRVTGVGDYVAPVRNCASGTLTTQDGRLRRLARRRPPSACCRVWNTRCRTRRRG